MCIFDCWRQWLNNTTSKFFAQNMIPEKVQALLNFIEFLDKNKNNYITKYLPLSDELNELDEQRNKLNPRENYRDKQSEIRQATVLK